LRAFSIVFILCSQLNVNYRRFRTFQIFFYALRPTFVRVQTLTRWHLINVVSQLLFDYILIKAVGLRPFIYLLMSSFFAGSLHPCSGHFIAEHYLWDGSSQETYSYYGPLNLLAYNVGVAVRCCSFLTLLHRLVTTMNITIFPPSHGHACLSCVL